MNLDKVFTKHNDAAHGWLEVSIEDLIDLNIQNKISNFSYIDSIKKIIYLEEDCDMTLFMNNSQLSLKPYYKFLHTVVS